ncbi:MAG: hypothetical protein IPO53_10305 [Chitinophagaceae bacterium]|nr:hypothetical protein [Chitinophagaceae bacterium]
MKKIIMGTMLLITANATFCQQNNPSPILTKQDYMNKSKHQKTAAILLFGGGFLMSATSLIIFTVKGSEDVINIIPGIITGDPEPQNHYTGATILLITGATSMLSSIPLFIASGKNKGKSISLSLKNQIAPQLQKNSFVYRTIPSLTIKINL